MLAILDEQDLLEFITEEPENEQSESLEDSVSKVLDKLKVAKIKKNKKCKTLLLNSMSDEQIVNTQFCKSAYDIWSTLASVYDRKSVAKRLHVARQLKSLKQENENLQDFFSKYDKLVFEYKQLGAQLAEVDIVNGLLLSVGTQYSTIVMTLESLP